MVGLLEGMKGYEGAKKNTGICIWRPCGSLTRGACICAATTATTRIRSSSPHRASSSVVVALASHARGQAFDPPVVQRSLSVTHIVIAPDSLDSSLCPYVRLASRSHSFSLSCSAFVDS